MSAEVLIDGAAHKVSDLTAGELAHALQAVQRWNQIAWIVSLDEAATKRLGGPLEKYDLRTEDREGLEDLAARWFEAKGSVLDTGVKHTYGPRSQPSK